MILGLSCTNIGAEPLKKLRVRLDELQLRRDDKWTTPTWFSPQFLLWEDGADAVELAPTEELTCFLARHDADWVTYSHIPFANSTSTPYLLDSGRWTAKMSWRAAELEPFTFKQDFVVNRNPNPNVHAGELRFAE